MQEWIKVSVSSHFPEKGIGDAILGSLKDLAEGVDGRKTWVGKTHGRTGSQHEPDGQGGECCGGENIEGYVGWGINSNQADAGHCPRSAWFSLCKMSRLEMSDWTFSVKPLMVASTPCNYWLREVIAGGDNSGEEEVEMSEKLGEVCR